ncbi:hypothetical protein AWB67_07546 [Caballeronia terrestris]|jgi:two-component system sensor kinase FixL|uniref:Uncharacterized protein n=1 Tax=Caballeronia terrestris TaxID=1226301 RepID=A0A158L5M3_9BURK|nr:hypothetical protein AWB67_07546 [Caballeronia terrestris]
MTVVDAGVVSSSDAPVRPANEAPARRAQVAPPASSEARHFHSPFCKKQQGGGRRRIRAYLMLSAARLLQYTARLGAQPDSNEARS